jgi:nitrate/TMAO reductase-like tetraheme cytochrome c subunit
VDRTDLSADLLTQDPRNCTRCHGDAGGTCTALQPCGIGQACQGGTCVNVSYTSPSARTCLSCHDSASAFAHAQLNTYADPSGPIESCPTCHGPDAAFAVKAVHAL